MNMVSVLMKKVSVLTMLEEEKGEKMSEDLWRDLNPVGLGCMGMSEFYGESDEENSRAVLSEAVAMGVNYFDTADTYGHGHNERLVGSSLRDVREDVLIGTKFGIVREVGKYERTIDNSPDYIRRALEASLERLGTGYVDVYFVHRMDPEASLSATMETLGALKEEGLIRAIGLSEVSALTLRRAHEIVPVDVLQTEYSLMTRDVEASILPACQELGVRFMSYSPMGRGLLTGLFRGKEDFKEGDFRVHLPRFAQDNLSHNRDLLVPLQEVAERHDATLGQVCLAWLLSKDKNMIVIPGTRSVKRLQENVGARSLRLSERSIRELDSVFSPERIAGARYTEAGMRGVNV